MSQKRDYEIYGILWKKNGEHVSENSLNIFIDQIYKVELLRGSGMTILYVCVCVCVCVCRMHGG